VTVDPSHYDACQRKARAAKRTLAFFFARHLGGG